MWWLYDAVVFSYFVIELVEIMGVVVVVEFQYSVFCPNFDVLW